MPGANSTILEIVFMKALNIAIIVGVSYLLLSTSERLIRRLLIWGNKYTSRREFARRLNTLVPLLQSLPKYIVIFFDASSIRS
jgi:hypothetical protein